MRVGNIEIAGEKLTPKSMTSAEIAAMASKPVGTIVYNSTYKVLQWWDGTAWQAATYSIGVSGSLGIIQQAPGFCTIIGASQAPSILIESTVDCTSAQVNYTIQPNSIYHLEYSGTKSLNLKADSTLVAGTSATVLLKKTNGAGAVMWEVPDFVKSVYSTGTPTIAAQANVAMQCFGIAAGTVYHGMIVVYSVT